MLLKMGARFSVILRLQRRRFAMMGPRTGDQNQLFYLFNLDSRIPGV
jgi:hypothetical protein